MKRLFLIFAAILITLPGVPVLAETQPKLTNETEYINYSIGYQMGTDFKNQGWELNPEVFVRGIQDALDGSNTAISKDLMQATLANLKRKLHLAQQQGAADYRRASDEFMKQNALKEGVVVLPSRVQYEVLREGTGRTPTVEDTVRVHFKLFKVDGTLLGSTYSNSDPRVVPLATAMSGLQEVITRMQEGAKYRLVLPAGMRAGNRETDDSGATIYELELISIKPRA